MFALSWQITLLCLLLFPILLLAARWVGRPAAGLTREQMDLNADMGNAMTERFNVAGALLVKLFGRPDEEDAPFAEQGRAACATSASGSRCSPASSSPR